MTKKESIIDPTSCFNKANEDEHLFVLLERDYAAPDTIRFWAQKRIDLGKNEASDPQIQQALLLARRIELAQQRATPQENPATK